MADANAETIRSVRVQFMSALTALLQATEKHATADGNDDADKALAYANAARALMDNELGKQLVVGKEGLVPR